MSENAAVDADALRAEVRSKYREVAIDPHGTYHFHTGRGLAARLGYDDAWSDSLPDAAVESFAGVANPFALRPLAGERVVDVGAGGGSMLLPPRAGRHGRGPRSRRVIGVDMTDEMLAKSRSTAAALGMQHVEVSRRAGGKRCRSRTAGPMSLSATA